MWVIFVPVIVANNSAARCEEPPTPDEAKLSLPGDARAASTRSLTLRIGEDGCTTITLGVVAGMMIGAKSRSTS
jgi:hypothetical protein